MDSNLRAYYVEADAINWRETESQEGMRRIHGGKACTCMATPSVVLAMFAGLSPYKYPSE